MKTRVMIFAWISVMSTAGTLVANESRVDSSASPGIVSHRSLSAIKLDVHAALRDEASTRRLGQNVPEIMRLIHLYRELAAHPKRENSDVLVQMGLQVRSRLEKVREHILRQYSHSARQATKPVQPAAIAPETHVLAQQLPGPGRGAPGQGVQPATTPPGASRAIDYGPELVELIQYTISPATWDINGGNGSVVYYAPLQVIVVSAPATVHGQIGNVLGQLRAAP